MKRTPQLFLIYLSVFLLSACGGGGESTATSTPPSSTENAAENNAAADNNAELFSDSRSAPTGDKVNTVGKTINRDAVGKTISTGAGTPGDIILYEFDRSSQLYRAENLTSGKEEYGEFDTYNDPQEKANSDIYHFEKDGSHFYGVELEDKFVATNFPGGTELVSIYSGINTKVNNAENFQYFDGAYIVLHLNLKEHDADQGYSEGMNWGLALFAHDPEEPLTGSFLMKIYNTNEWLPEQVNLEEEISLMQEEIAMVMQGDLTFEVDGEVLIGGYTVNEENLETFDTYFIDLESASIAEEEEDFIDMGLFFAGMGFANEEEAVMIIDLGVGNGYFQMLRITDMAGEYSEYDPSGSYLYIQSDVDYGSGGGFLSIEEREGEGHYGVIDREHYPQDFNEEDGPEEDFELILHKADLPCIYYTDYESVDGESDMEGGERMYIITNYDFFMHFSLSMDPDGGKELLNFGVGAFSGIE
ncbi:MAG: hypothetical protein R8P61_26675 [Bacteroidia bacterium]|nr:hypothetical protein [Bacteroidia bacterium]